MAIEPRWYTQISWSDPITLERLRLSGESISEQPGVYLFHVDKIKPSPGRVRYVGEAKNLKKRLRAYAIDYMIAKNYDNHRGRLFIFSAHRSYPYRLYVRWAVYGGHRNELEASLIHYLQPWYNTRDEEARHGVLADDERLDPRYLP